MYALWNAEVVQANILAISMLTGRHKKEQEAKSTVTKLKMTCKAIFKLGLDDLHTHAAALASKST